MWRSIVRICLSAIVFALPVCKGTFAAGGAKTPDSGTILRMVTGDRTCYVDLVDGQGEESRQLASFEVCRQDAIIGRPVRLGYAAALVQSPSCEGAVDCDRYDSLVLIESAELLEQPAEHEGTLSSHCSTKEQVLFSCDTEAGKNLSLCASSELGPTAGYLQYRYGPIGSPAELVYPQEMAPPARRFLAGSVAHAGGGAAFLRFAIGKYRYAVFSGIGRGWQKHGVVVDKSGHYFSHALCRRLGVSEIGHELFERASIPFDPNAAEFELP